MLSKNDIRWRHICAQQRMDECQDGKKNAAALGLGARNGDAELAYQRSNEPGSGQSHCNL